MKTNTTLRAAASSAAENPGFRSRDLRDVKTRQLIRMAQYRLEQNWIESIPANFKGCRARVLQLVVHSEKLTKKFSFHAFPFKNGARKWGWQLAMNWWDLATKKWEAKHHDVLCSKHFEKKKKMLHRSHTAEHSVWAQIHVCVYSSFHNRVDLIREPAFYWVFYFIFP